MLATRRTTTFSRVKPGSWHKKKATAPHREISLAQAISDLPAFEWENPHNVVESSREEIQNRLERASKIDQFRIEPERKYVGYNQQKYASKPRNEFQRRLRRNTRDSTLHNHVTVSWFDRPKKSTLHGGWEAIWTERVCNIPLLSLDKDACDHRDLPDALKCTFHPDSKAAKNNFYPKRLGRLHLNRPFPTFLTTSIHPSTKKSQVKFPGEQIQCLELIIFISSFTQPSIELSRSGNMQEVKDFQIHLCLI